MPVCCDVWGKQVRRECAGPNLPELDVVEFGVGVDVGVGDADELAAPLRGSVRVGRIQRLQHHNQRHVVLRARLSLAAADEKHNLAPVWVGSLKFSCCPF